MWNGSKNYLRVKEKRYTTKRETNKNTLKKRSANKNSLSEKRRPVYHLKRASMAAGWNWVIGVEV